MTGTMDATDRRLAAARQIHAERAAQPPDPLPDVAALEAAYDNATAALDERRAYLAEVRAELAGIDEVIIAATGKAQQEAAARRVTLEALVRTLPAEIGRLARQKAEADLWLMRAQKRVLEAELATLGPIYREGVKRGNKLVRAANTLDDLRLPHDEKAARKEELRAQQQALGDEVRPTSERIDRIEFDIRLAEVYARNRYGPDVKLDQPGAWPPVLATLEERAAREAAKG